MKHPVGRLVEDLPEALECRIGFEPTEAVVRRLEQVRQPVGVGVGPGSDELKIGPSEEALTSTHQKRDTKKGPRRQQAGMSLPLLDRSGLCASKLYLTEPIRETFLVTDRRVPEQRARVVRDDLDANVFGRGLPCGHLIPEESRAYSMRA
jgi:hypothetical protein